MSRYENEPLSSAIAPPALVPAGLPAAYVGTWAVIGLASLAYLATAATEITGNSARQATSPMASLERPLPKRVEPEVEIARLPVSPTPAMPSGGFTSARPIPEKPPTPPHADSDMPTRYVTTHNIIARAKPANDAAPPPAEAREETVVTGSLMKPPPPPERAPPRPAVSRTALKPAVAPAAEPSASWAQTTRQALAETRAEAETGFQTAVVTSPRGADEPGLGILLASGSSVDSLRRTWDVLRTRHALDFDGLEPRYIVEPNADMPDRRYALLVGPVASATEIARVCSVLVSEGLMCRTRNFTGNRF